MQNGSKRWWTWRWAATFLFTDGTLLSGAAQAANEDLLKGLPDNLMSLYEGDTETLQPSAYDNFNMPAPPWKWCHSESYQGNPWRVALTNELKRLVDVYKAAGKISDFEMSDSNNDVGQQIAQRRAARGTLQDPPLTRLERTHRLFHGSPPWLPRPETGASIARTQGAGGNPSMKGTMAFA